MFRTAAMATSVALLAAGLTSAPAQAAESAPAQVKASSGDAAKRACADPFPEAKLLGSSSSGATLHAKDGAPVHSMKWGKVVLVLRYTYKGQKLANVRVAHGNGLQSDYESLSKVTVRRGEYVGAGDLVGRMGSKDGKHAGVYSQLDISRRDLRMNPQAWLHKHCNVKLGR